MAENKPIVAYVLAPDNAPLMPCHSHGRVKRMLKSERARIVSTYPFTIRLNYEPETRGTQRVLLGPDPGRKNCGLTAILEDGTVLYAANLETRNTEIKPKMQKRAGSRNLRRSYRRAIRKRFARRSGNVFGMKFRDTGMGIRPHAILKKRKDYPLRDLVQSRYHNLTADQFQFVWMRMLPSYEKPVILHDIINKEARFLNRKREEGWLTPTARQLLETCLNQIHLVRKILPVTDIVQELNKFDIAKMDHPAWWGEDYCHGPLYGYKGRNRKERLHAAVDDLQQGHCIFCKQKNRHYHHIRPVSRGGTDTVENVAGVCDGHHDQLHKDRALFEDMVARKESLNKKNGLLSVINQIMPRLKKELEKLPGVRIHYTDGKTTKAIRERFHLPKDHYIDAWCIAVSVLDPDKVRAPEFPEETLFHIMQFRRHDRAYTKRLEGRKYLNAEKKVVAVNRKKAIQAVPKDDGTLEEKKQTGDSLAEYREKLVNQYLAGVKNPTEADRMAALKEAEKAISRLKVVKGHRVYNDLDRVMPGATYRIKETGELIVMRGQHNNGERIYHAYPGLEPLKSYVRSLKKKAGVLKRGGKEGSEEYLALQKQIAAIEATYPNDKDIAVVKLELVKQNSGLVYVPKNAAFPV